MILTQNYNPFLNTVLKGLEFNSPSGLKEVKEWLNEALQSKEESEKIEEKAKLLIKEFHGLQRIKSSSRYKFTAISAKNELLKIIFDQSFNRNSNAIIEEVKKIDPKYKPLYSPLKKVCQIQIPKTSAKVFGNPLVKIALSISIIYISFLTLYRCSNVIRDVLIRKVVPIAINNIPVQFFNASNVIANRVGWVAKYRLLILLGVVGVKNGIRCLPEIPYLTRAINRLNLIKIYRALFISTETIFQFALKNSLNTIVMGWKLSTSISVSLNDIANRSEKECLHASKEKALIVWKNLFIEIKN